jgi:hypothetical protein
MKTARVANREWSSAPSGPSGQRGTKATDDVFAYTSRREWVTGPFRQQPGSSQFSGFSHGVDRTEVLLPISAGNIENNVVLPSMRVKESATGLEVPIIAPQVGFLPAARRLSGPFLSSVLFCEAHLPSRGPDGRTCTLFQRHPTHFGTVTRSGLDWATAGDFGIYQPQPSALICMIRGEGYARSLRCDTPVALHRVRRHRVYPPPWPASGQPRANTSVGRFGTGLTNLICELHS